MKKTGSIILIFLIILFALIAFNYVSYREKNAVSDAAFVKSDSLLTLSFKVGGKVINLTKKEGDEVKKGELLAKIDDRDFKIAKEKIDRQIEAMEDKKASLEIEKEKIERDISLKLDILRNDKSKLSKNIEAFKFEISSLKAKLSQAKRDKERIKSLYKNRLVQKRKLEDFQTKVDILSDTIKAKEAKLNALKIDLKNLDKKIEMTKNSQKEIDRLKKEIDSLQKNIKATKKAKEEIENKISYTYLYSPIDGIVAKRFINKDRIIKKGSAIYSIVDINDLHIEVLLSEKKLKGVKVGNEVKIEIDAYPDRDYKGEVSKILPASAATFSLVPRDIASGEFTKLDQRFTVRISIKNPTKDLRVGMGASVAIKRETNGE